MVSDELHLLVSIQSHVFLISVGSSAQDKLFSGSRPVLSLDYDWKEQKVYWVRMEAEAEAVAWTTLDKKSSGTLIRGADQPPMNVWGFFFFFKKTLV